MATTRLVLERFTDEGSNFEVDHTSVVDGRVRMVQLGVDGVSVWWVEPGELGRLTFSSDSALEVLDGDGAAALVHVGRVRTAKGRVERG